METQTNDKDHHILLSIHHVVHIAPQLVHLIAHFGTLRGIVPRGWGVASETLSRKDAVYL